MNKLQNMMLTLSFILIITLLFQSFLYLFGWSTRSLITINLIMLSITTVFTILLRTNRQLNEAKK